MQSLDIYNVQQAIEHTCLKPQATPSDIIQLCQEAIKYQFYAVCINSAWVNLANENLNSSSVKIVSTAAFPLGASATIVKCREVEYAISLGAHEVDFVLNIGWLKCGDLHNVAKEFQALVEVASGNPLKVILETSILTDQEKKIACQLAVGAGIAFVKTSTGFNTGGATVEDIKLMRHAVGKKAGIKASGGIRDLQTAKNLLEAGADRLGTSSGIVISQVV
ncbi:MAG: deoxyribose-phosphate aldolase [Parachlamydiaceae bacterium]|nr:deoxyribose-phosphate aldolase [Parachlamydiaceae bacterium]